MVAPRGLGVSPRCQLLTEPPYVKPPLCSLRAGQCRCQQSQQGGVTTTPPRCAPCAGSGRWASRSRRQWLDRGENCWRRAYCVRTLHAGELASVWTPKSVHRRIVTASASPTSCMRIADLMWRSSSERTSTCSSAQVPPDSSWKLACCTIQSTILTSLFTPYEHARSTRDSGRQHDELDPR